MNIKTNSPKVTISGTSSVYTISGLAGSTGTFGATGSVGSSTTTVTSVGGTFSGSFIGYHHTVVNKVKYHVLGKDVEVEGPYKDPTTSLYVSLVNIHGKVFYDEVKKQGVDFPKEIDEYLKVNLVSWERDKKLNILL